LIANRPETFDSAAVVTACSCDELADATGGSDALLGNLGEHLGADNARSVGELSLAEHLEEALCKIVYYLIKRNLLPWTHRSRQPWLR